MLRIGLTGGMGSGKTTVARIFEILGVPVYNADVAAKKLMQEDEGLKSAIIQHFGIEIYPDGKLNRGYLASIVFGNPQNTALLNSLVHPVTIRDAAAWMKDPCGNGILPPYAVKEAALIFESGSEKNLDYVIGVDTPIALRIERSMKRDGISKEEVLQRMDRQMDETEKLSRCQFIISNNENDLLIPQVLSIHQHLLKIASHTH